MKYLAIVLVSFGVFSVVNAEELSCPVGQMPAEVMTDPGTDGTPAVTHEETRTVEDSPAIPARDEVIEDSPAHTSCDNVGFVHGDYKHSNCTGHGQWWEEIYKWVSHPAVTHTVHHDAVPAVTHEETFTVEDSPAVPGTDPTYEMQCVTDESYVPPVPVVEEPVVVPPKNTNIGGTQPICLRTGECPCFGMGKFLDACIAQKYPNGQLCELKPWTTPLECKDEPVDELGRIQKMINDLIAQVNALMAQLGR